MAVANTKSTIITNLDATPAVKNPLYLMGGVVREAVGTVEIAAADCDTSVYRMVRVHSSWRIANIIRYNDAITSGADFDVGLYETAENGGAVKNINCFADAVSLASGVVVGVEDLFEAGADEGVEDLGKRVFEFAGETTDPNRFYDLCYTGVTVGSGAGTLSVRVQYIANT
jgi:hypothetical protein